VAYAYATNFERIKGDAYRMSGPRWVHRSTGSPDAAAVCVFDFDWSGLVDGRSVSGRGCGTIVLVQTNDGWRLIAEHLGPMSD